MFRDGKEVASVGKKNDVSRAEDLLPNIEKLLNASFVKLEEIDRIAVSRGPGSYTGIRIGISTALGLARALNLSCFGVSVLEAMAILGGHSRKIITAVPFSKNEVVWQKFELYEETHYEKVCSENVVTFGDFYSAIESMTADAIILHEDLCRDVKDRSVKILDEAQVINAGKVLAGLIGRFSMLYQMTSDISPIYSLNLSRDRGLF